MGNTATLPQSSMSNGQMQTRGIGAGDWVRLKRLQASRNYYQSSTTSEQDSVVGSNRDINTSPTSQLQYARPISVFKTVGTSKIRRPASSWIDFKASQTADFPKGFNFPGLETGTVQISTRLCDCSPIILDTKVAGCTICRHNNIENPPAQLSVSVPGFTNFWNYEMYKSASDGPTPNIYSPSTWGTRNDSLLVELMTSSDASSPCGYGVDGTIIPRKVDQKWDYSVLRVTGFFTAPFTGNYVFDVSSDDGLQFILNDTLIMDQQGFSTSGSGQTTPIDLVADTKYPITLLWSNGTGGSHCCFTAIYVNESPSLMSTGTPFNSLCSPS